jgi:hypothetical protein
LSNAPQFSQFFIAASFRIRCATDLPTKASSCFVGSFETSAGERQQRAKERDITSSKTTGIGFAASAIPVFRTINIMSNI